MTEKKIIAVVGATGAPRAAAWSGRSSPTRRVRSPRGR